MLNIIFQDETHQQRYYTCISTPRIKSSGNERLSLFYLLTLDFLADHIQAVYDFESNRLMASPEEILAQSWITGGSRRALTLAFNLFNGYQNEATTPLDLMNYGNVDYFLQAIRIRFHLK